VFRIGDFSRIARVSCRLLRHYDELGLLKPVRVDGSTGYRYYGAAQLPSLHRILVLKELGLSLEQIRPIVEGNVSVAELRGMLLMRRAQAEQALSAEADRLQRIEARIAQIDAEGSLSADDVLLRPEPQRRLLAVRERLPSFAAARGVIGELLGALPGALAPGTLGELVAIAHAAEFEPDDLDVELGFFLHREPYGPCRLPSGRVASVRTLPAVERMAVCVREGPPEQAHLATERIGRFVERHGYRLAGPGREVFLKRPAPERMSDAIVEMQFPLESAAT
jgi:DNA-binding transcriptional MerR regulator